MLSVLRFQSSSVVCLVRYSLIFAATYELENTDIQKVNVGAV